jgi:dipeptide/tripeptide permease
MGIIVNLVTYLKGTMHQSSTTSSNSTSNVAGTSFLLCLLGGILADSFLGRYWTIAIFSVIHALVCNIPPEYIYIYIYIYISVNYSVVLFGNHTNIGSWN